MAEKDDVWGDDAGDTSSDESKDESKDTEGAASGDKGSESSPSLEEQLRTLQSERDKAIARANKAEGALKGKSGTADAGASAGKGDELPPQVREWVTAAEDRYRDQLYNEVPEFATHGLDRSLIVGATPAEMRASAEALKKLVSGIEANTRDKVLKEHGFDPEPRGSQREPRKDVSKMSSKEFDEYMRSVMPGQWGS